MAAPNYNPITGKTRRTCQYIHCGNTFEGHGNRRYCHENCKKKMEFSRRNPRLLKKFYVDDRAKVYSRNIAVLQKLLKYASDQSAKVSNDKLLKAGFEHDSPSDAIPGDLKVPSRYSNIRRFGPYYLYSRSYSNMVNIMQSARIYALFKMMI